MNFHGVARDKQGREARVYGEAKAKVRRGEVAEFAEIARNSERLCGPGLRIIVGSWIYGEGITTSRESRGMR